MAGFALNEIGLHREPHFGNRSVLCLTPRPHDMRDIFDTAVRLAPERVAVRDAQRALTYAALDAEATKFASALGAAGLCPGDRIALNTGNRIEFVVGLLAAFKAGFIAMPVGHRHRRAELVGFIAMPASVRFCAMRKQRRNSQTERRCLRFDFISVSLRMFERRGARYILCRASGDGAVAPAVRTAENRRRCLRGADVHVRHNRQAKRGEDHPFRHGSHTVLHYRMVFQLKDGEVSVLAVPCTHVTGLAAQILVMFGCAGTLVMMPHFDTGRFVELAAQHALTYTIMVPAMYTLLLHRDALKNVALPTWRIGAFGGAPMPEAIRLRLAETLPHLSLHNAYGATETTSPATLVPLGLSAVTDSVGRVVPCGELRIVDDAVAM